MTTPAIAPEADLSTRTLRRRRLDDGSTLVTTVVPLPFGWNQQETIVEFLLPVPFPSAQPDCFYAEPQLRLASGAMPVNSGFQPLENEQRLWFSWHLAAWSPATDTVETYLRFIERRLRDVR